MSPPRRVSLLATCLVDQVWPSVGESCVQVLRKTGCVVEFEAQQTCCGQPAYNTGYRDDARALARRFIEIFEGSTADGIVCPSGSCTAMVQHYADLFTDESWRARARAVADRTYELSSFLVNVLGIEDVGASFNARVTWHDACHGLRELGLKTEPRRLLNNVRGLQLVELPNAETCCGFGGTFSVKYPEISVAMVDQKVAAIASAGVAAVISGDVSCLMQIEGRLARQGVQVRAMHLAEVLASGLERR